MGAKCPNRREVGLLRNCRPRSGGDICVAEAGKECQGGPTTNFMVFTLLGTHLASCERDEATCRVRQARIGTTCGFCELLEVCFHATENLPHPTGGLRLLRKAKLTIMSRTRQGWHLPVYVVVHFCRPTRNLKWGKTCCQVPCYVGKCAGYLSGRRMRYILEITYCRARCGWPELLSDLSTWRMTSLARDRSSLRGCKHSQSAGTVGASKLTYTILKEYLVYETIAMLGMWYHNTCIFLRPLSTRLLSSQAVTNLVRKG